MEIPRRAQLEHQTPVEAAIRDAVLAVETLPPDVRLSDAVSFLFAALDSVADYVDNTTTWRRRLTVSPWASEEA